MTDYAPVFTSGSFAVTRISTSATGEPANNASDTPAFLPDGSKVVFESLADNLVPGDTNNAEDIFVKDLATGAVTLVSTAADGTLGNSSSYLGYNNVVSPDSSKVVFYSSASNLVPGDTNGFGDYFVKDLTTGAVTMVNSTADGTPGHRVDYYLIGIFGFSPDSSRILFESTSDNLVPGDTNGTWDVFVKDLATGAVTLVNSAADGTQGDNSAYSGITFSPDGSKVLFTSAASNLVPGDTNGTWDIFVKDLATGAVTLVNSAADGTPGNGTSSEPVFSPDGSKVLFTSTASNLVPGDTNGHHDDIFLKDLATGAVTLLSTAADGTQGNLDSMVPTFSPDGSKVLFQSSADNLVPGDTNEYYDYFVKDLTTGAVTMVDSAADGTPGTSGGFGILAIAFSSDGSKVLFNTFSSNLVPGDTNGGYDYFVKDLTTGAVTLVNSTADDTQGNGNGDDALFSPDGSKVLFRSSASNLVPGDTNGISDYFVKDLATGAVTLVNSTADGTPGNGDVYGAVFSPDGSKVLFQSYASNQVPGDTNGTPDYFVKDLTTGAVILVNSAADGTGGNGGYLLTPTFSPDGSKVLFDSYSSNLVAGDTNGTWDIFLKDLAPSGPPSVTAAFLTDNPALATLSASGPVYFTDADSADSHTVSTAPQAGALGSLSATVVADGIGTGHVAWTYSVDEALLKSLGAGETHTDTFTLTLDDGNGGTATQDVVVTLNGIEDAPVLSAPAAVNFAENGSGAVLLASASDPDGDALAYSLSGADAHLFAIAADGSLSFKAAPDFEAPADAGGNNVYDLTLTASDGTLSASQAVAVTVTDVAEATIAGDGGSNALFGTAGNDVIAAGGGNDFVWAGAGNDTVHGDAGNDALFGGAGNDRLLGGAGHDLLYGGAGSDTLTGGTGNDLLAGGAGSDTFVFQPGFGNDVVADFDANPAGGQDYLDLAAFGVGADNFADRVSFQAQGLGTLVTIDHDPDQTILLLQVARATLSAADFHLA